MRSTSAAIKYEAHSAPENVAAFAREVSDLCRKHGLGLGDATVYEMLPEDYKFNYRVDDDSQLVLG